MGSSKVVHQRFILKLNLICPCHFHWEQVKKLVEKIDGVEEVSIDAKHDKATISGNVDPHKVVKQVLEPEGKGKKLVINAELYSGEERIPSPPIIDNHLQELQIVSHQKPAPRIFDQRMLTNQPADVALKAVCAPVDKKTQDLYPKCKHKLEKKISNKPFLCTRCKEEGIRLRYSCKHCDFVLHKECKDRKPTITHEFFSGSTFEYCPNPSNKICDACGRGIHGCSYHCKAKKLDLHPRCSKLERTLHSRDFVLCDKVQSKCLLCKKKKLSELVDKKVQGLYYVSKSKSNKFSCHVHCLARKVHDAWKERDCADVGDANTSMAQEIVYLQLLAVSNRRDGEGGVKKKVLKKIAIFIWAIVGSLVGDPSALLVSFFAEAILK